MANFADKTIWLTTVKHVAILDSEVLFYKAVIYIATCYS